jgi:hypothetical protein
LYHAGAATFTNQPLDRNRHFGIWGGLLGVQRSKQTRSTTTQNQNIGIMTFN